MAETALDSMIELWRGIQKLHFDEYARPLTTGLRTVAEMRRNERLNYKAQMVVLALVHYKEELNR
jgi:hypothetical protein